MWKTRDRASVAFESMISSLEAANPVASISAGFLQHLKKVMDSPRSAKKAKMANGEIHQSKTARAEMCFFCFDVLVARLNSAEPPTEPKFTNESL